MPSPSGNPSTQGHPKEEKSSGDPRHLPPTHHPYPECASIPIAVVGIGALFPGSTDAGGFWRDILAGKDHIREVPETHFFIDDFYDKNPMTPDKTYCRKGAFLSPVEFDPMEYGIPPTNIASTDTSQLLGLIVAKQVLTDATNGQFKHMDRSRVSVILGVAAGLELMGEMVGRLGRPVQVKALREEGLPEDKIQAICDRIANSCTPWKESTFPGLLGNVVAGRIANHFDLGGINCTSDAACASSFSALSAAVQELQLHHSDLVITGGVDTNNDPFLFVSFSKTPALSPTEDCRPFSDKADGMILGEGIGMIALKRLADAEKDGDRIYAVIRGVGKSSDGAGTSIYSPVAEGQAMALRRAYENAGYSPSTVALVEAHGTGTIAGDSTEFKGLSMVFNEAERKERQWCALGSVKSQIGHTKSSAAAAGIIKAILAVHHKILPPTIKVERPDPKLKIEESPFYVNTQARPWVKNKNYPRRASVSSFGFGGTNFHVTLEEYAGRGNKARRMRTSPGELFVFSGNSVAELFSTIKETEAGFEAEKGMFLFLARESQTRFKAEQPLRLAIVASDEEDLKKKARQAREKIAEKPEGAFSLPGGISFGTGDAQGKIAFIFPGQGSQYVNMGADLAMQFYDFQEVWDATETISWNDGKDRLAEKVFPIPVFSNEEMEKQSQRLTQTLWAQPAILTTSLAMSRILGELGVKPDCVGGHSLGEITAMLDAGVLDLEPLLDVCRERSILMAKAAEKKGAMTAVVTTFETMESLLKEWKSEAVVANHNSPEQVVISGPVPAVEEAEKRMQAQKIRFKRLQVSAAFHSTLMSDACDPFLSYLKKKALKKPVIPFYSCVKGAPHDDHPETIAALLAKQLNHPVRFVEQILSMYENGVRLFLEVGPSPVLTGLVGKILKGKPHSAISLDVKKEHGMMSLLKTLGQLAAAGLKLNLDYLWDGYASPEDPRLRKKPKISLSLMGCNYNRPYPPKEGKAALPKPNPKRLEPPVATIPKETSPSIRKIEPGPIPMESTQMNDTVSSKNISSPKAIMNQPFSTAPVSGPSNDSGPAAAHAPCPVPLAIDDSWVNAFHDIQRQTADAHISYQKSMAESHVAFLKTMEASTLTLTRMLDGSPLTGRTNTEMGAAMPPPAFKAPYPSAIIVPEPLKTGRPLPVLPTPLPALETPIPVIEKKREAPPVEKSGEEAPPALPEGVDFKEMLLSIVAEKTGYPREILGEEMGLEADLGIDSIKRVEILSAVKDESPWLPEVDPSEMGNIETLGDVIRYIEKAAPRMTTARAPSKSLQKGSDSAPPMEAPEGVDFKEMLLSIVAEKTGYPREILGEEMGLESDLGIDSIKRVEILSAVKDESPWLPEVDPSEMGNIETLGDVIRYIEKAAPSISKSKKRGGAAPVPEPLQETGKAIPQGVDFKEMLLSIVAEKTGYPRDILTEEMGLESDLGIDSIKRVEILSAVKDESPWLPEVDPSEMGNIETLKDVIDYIERMAPSVKKPSPALRAATPLAPETGRAPSSGLPAGIDFKEMLLKIVAEKTGYPRDILTMEMGLEADLGIDSIKRVEILSAVKDESPWLPEIDPADMAAIETLKDVVDFVEKALPGMNKEVSEEAAVGPGKTQSAVGAAPKLGRYLLREVEAPYSGFAMKGLKTARLIAITDDGNGVAQALEAVLRLRNINARAVKSIPAEADGLIFLGGLKQISGPEEAMAVNREAFLAVKSLAPAFASSGALLVTVQDTGGDFGLSGACGPRFLIAGLTGLVKTAAIEWLDLPVKAIDIDSAQKTPQEIAKEISKELLNGGPEIEVGLKADGGRVRLDSFEQDVNPEEARIDQQAVIVASGGARGVTAKTLIALAQATRCSLVLLGRTPLTGEPAFLSAAATDGDLKKALLEEAKQKGKKITPAELGREAGQILAIREIKATLKAIEEAGSRVRYLETDVQDEEKLSHELDGIRKEWGPITGIVHGAGVLIDKLIADKTAEQFDRVFNTKVKGLLSLLAVTEKDPLTVICLFSSVAARFGNMGQSDYAMANEVLNKAADVEARKRKGTALVKAINWGPWDGGMVSPLLKEHFKKMGIPLIPLDQGAKTLVSELLESGSSHAEIVIGPKPPKAGLSIRSAETGVVLSVPVNENRYPFIKSHTIKGTPVVPAVLILEWFTRAAHLFNPDMVITACKDLRVYQGIKLPEFGKKEIFLTVNCRQISNGDHSVLSLELPGEKGAPHYTATIEMQKTRAVVRKAVQGAGDGAEGAWPYTLKEVYGKRLFHGPDFQTIKALSGVSDTSASALLSGVADMKWPGTFWKTDAAALDGGLQLAILWGERTAGRISLPTKIGAYLSYQEGGFGPHVRCELKGRLSGNDRTVSDILFYDQTSHLMAELRDVEMHMLPDAP